MIYTTKTGSVMTQDGPVAIPMQSGGGMVAVQTVTPRANSYEPQVVMAPVAEADCYPSQLGQVAPAGAICTGYQPQKVQATAAVAVVRGYQRQQFHIPPSYTRSEYDEVRLV